LLSLGLLGGMIGYIWLSPYTTGGMRGFSSMMGGSSGGPAVDLVASNIIAVLSMLLLIPLPFIVCSGLDGERKFWPNGSFNFREMLRGTPSGGLPFIILGFLAIAVGVLIPSIIMTSSTYEIFLATLVWGAGFWVFCWSLGKLASSTSLELKSARTIHLALLIVCLGLPIPFLAIIDTEQTSWLWKAYPLYPLWADPSETVYLRYAIGVALLVIGGVIAIVSNRKLQMKLAASSVTA